MAKIVKADSLERCALPGGLPQIAIRCVVRKWTHVISVRPPLCKERCVGVMPFALEVHPKRRFSPGNEKAPPALVALADHRELTRRKVDGRNTERQHLGDPCPTFVQERDKGIKPSVSLGRSEKNFQLRLGEVANRLVTS